MLRYVAHCMRMWCLGAVALGACGGPDATAGPVDVGAGEGTSETVLASLIGARAYVALPPASVPGAHRALVRAQGGDSAGATARDGGFDPLAVGASAGDLVTVTVTDSSGRVTTTSVKVAPRPPRVVRLSPAERRTDVPLNARVLVVFSVPMDPATTGARVHLRRGEAPAAGRVELVGGGTVAEFVPAEPLVALTEYTLVVDGAVTDELGTPMGEPVSGTFRTGSHDGQVASMALTPTTTRCDPVWLPCASLQLARGEFLSVTYHLFDARGQLLQGAFSVTLRSSNDSVLRPGPWSASTSVVEVRGFGSAMLEASTAGVTASLGVVVTSPVPLERLRSLAVLEVRDEAQGVGLWRVPLDFSEPIRLAGTEELGAPTQCDESQCHPTYEFAVAQGGRIAITSRGKAGGVWVKDPGPSAPRAVLSSGSGAARSPAWSADGQRLAYWLDRPDVGESELRVVGADGSDERVLRRIPLPTGVEAPVVWEADGERLLLWNEQGTEAVGLDGSAPSPYLAGYLAGPTLADGRTQLMYGLGNYGSGVAPGYTYALYADGALQGPWAISPPHTPLDVTPDAALVAYADGVLTVGGQWSYFPNGRIIGFAR